MNVTGDRITEHGLSTVGFDDEGVAAQSWDIVKDGILVGYQLDRRIAAAVNKERSNGCAYADSPSHVPIQRMPNVSLKADPNGPDLKGLIESNKMPNFLFISHQLLKYLNQNSLPNRCWKCHSKTDNL